ncbi:MAG: glycosyltransferase family 4 protein [Pseudomonadota bacterium]
MILLYANHPIVKSKTGYYAELKNFIDFLSELSGCSSVYHLIVPVKIVSDEDLDGLTPIDLKTDNIIHVKYYKGHVRALIFSFINTFAVAKLVRAQISKKGTVVIACPGPNSFLFLLSLLSPREVKFSFFIRGDTIKTLHNMYKGTLMYYIAMPLVKTFRWRICQLLKQGRADVFTYGEALLSQYPANKELQHVIAPLIDESWIKTSPIDRVSDSNKYKVLFVGRLSKEKNVIALINACLKSQKKGTQFELTIIGDGPLYSHVKRLTHNSTIVHVLGKVSHGVDLMRIYDTHDLLCLPSFTEGTPRVVVEAIARGLPVLSTNVGSIDRMFPDIIQFTKGFTQDDLLVGIEYCRKHRIEIRDKTLLAVKQAYKYTIQSQANVVHKVLKSRNF